jgi:hypothetical protein
MKLKSLSKQIIPIGACIVGLLFLVLGLTKYGFWDPMQGPRPGFYPVIISIGLIATSILAFIGSFKDKDASFPVENWYCAIGLIAIILASFVIGMVPSILAFLLLWLRWFEKCTWKTTIITTIVMMAIVIGAFVLWLDVDFPMGIIYNLIAG